MSDVAAVEASDATNEEEEPTWGLAEGDESEDDDDDQEEAPPQHPFDGMDPHEGALFLQLLLQTLGHGVRDRETSAASHEDLCDRMRRVTTNEAVIDAFSAVDRNYFAMDENDDREAHLEEVYSDRPYRDSLVHMSAPSIYIQVLDALDLRAGLSFLNIGSGTGYLSAIVAKMIGPHACHHGVETRQGLVVHSTERLSSLGLESIRIHHGSLHGIDRLKSMRFDRIYVGAGGTSEDRAFIVGMLKEGGICVGPFANDMGEQSLDKLTRMEIVQESEAQVQTAAAEPEEGDTETTTAAAATAAAAAAGGGGRARFRVRTECLQRVSFAPLVGKERTRSLPMPIVLSSPRWSQDNPLCFPGSFRRVVALLYWACTSEGGSGGEAVAAADASGGEGEGVGLPAGHPAVLPWDLWQLHILPHLEFDAFEPPWQPPPKEETKAEEPLKAEEEEKAEPEPEQPREEPPAVPIA